MYALWVLRMTTLWGNRKSGNRKTVGLSYCAPGPVTDREGSTPAGLDGQGGVSGQGIHVVITTCDTTKFLYCKTNDHLVPYRGGAEKTTYTLFLRLGRATYIKHHNIAAHHVRVHNSKSTSPALPAL
jgi:hypothetical protein